MEIDPDPPTLDLSALTLTQPAPSGSSLHRKTAAPSRPPHHSPSPPPTRPAAAAAAAEDDEIEDLYGPPLGLPSIHAPPPPPLPPREPSPQPSAQPPAESAPPAKPRLLPVLAAEDPHVLEALERHERRHGAARPRQGTRKMQAVPRAGARRGGFVLVADRAAEEAVAVKTCREPRGVFASYFARSGAWS